MSEQTPITLTADPEVINKWLAEQILQSTIGKTLVDKARSVLNEYKFQGAIEDTLRHMVLNKAREYVEGNTEFNAMVVAAVAKAVTPEVIKKMAEVAVSKLERY